MRTWLVSLAPLTLAGLLACGGQSSNTPAPPSTSKMDPDTAAALTVPFETTEANQAGEMDGSGPVPAGEALSMVQPSHPDCVTVSNVTASSVTWTFNSCTGPHGWTWNGVVVISWARNADGTVLVKHDHQNFVGTKDGKTWTINGIKDHLRNPATKMVTLTAEPGFTKTFNNGTTTTTYTFTCALTADWSTQGQRKLYGTWAMTPATGDAVSASIAPTTPLVWDKAAGCCYAISGTVELAKGAKTATIVHGMPCGTVTINGTSKLLPPCSM
ncbi:MAG: hypothetical protein KGN80_06385 [Acidobacteriota bacterium]|nr:hypothetical protein [Acidobacteriota bacterium]